MIEPWTPDADRCRLECIHLGPVELRQGDRVRLRPRNRADIFDIALDGQVATIEAIERDFEGRVYLAVTLDGDPGRWKARTARTSSAAPSKCWAIRRRRQSIGRTAHWPKGYSDAVWSAAISPGQWTQAGKAGT